MSTQQIVQYDQGCVILAQSRWAPAWYLPFQQWCAGWKVADVYLDDAAVLTKILCLPAELTEKDQQAYLKQQHRQLLGWDGEVLSYQYWPWHADQCSAENKALLMAVPQSFIQSLQESMLQDKMVLRNSYCRWQYLMVLLVQHVQHQSPKADYRFIVHLAAQSSLCIGLYQKKLVYCDMSRLVYDEAFILKHYQHYQMRCRPGVGISLWYSTASKEYLPTLTDPAIHWFDLPDQTEMFADQARKGV